MQVILLCYIQNRSVLFSINFFQGSCWIVRVVFIPWSVTLKEHSLVTTSTLLWLVCYFCVTLTDFYLNTLSFSRQHQINFLTTLFNCSLILTISFAYISISVVKHYKIIILGLLQRTIHIIFILITYSLLHICNKVKCRNSIFDIRYMFSVKNHDT